MEVSGYGIRDKCAFLGEGVGWKLFFKREFSLRYMSVLADLF